MKKFLLSILSFAAIATAASAQVTLSADDAADFDGTLVEETLKDDGTVKAYKHYQPVKSLTISGYKFSFASTSDKDTQQPAYYWAKEGAAKTIRLYTGSTMTIAAPEGVTITGIEFKGSNAGKPLEPTVDTGKLTYENNKATWTGSTSKIALSTNATWRILSMTVYTDGKAPEQPVTPPAASEDYFTYDLASAIESGKTYAFYASDSVATTVSATKTYGYLYGTPATEEDGSFTAKASAGFKFTAVEGGYNIQDNLGRYLWMDSTFNSFQFAAEVPAEKKANAVWSVKVAADGTADIVNTVKNKTMMWSHTYHSIGAYAEINSDMVAPALYLQGAKSAAPEQPEQPEQPATDAVYEAAVKVVSGSKYIMVIGEQYGAAIGETASYGRLSLTDAAVVAGKVTAPKAAAITFTEVEGKGFTMTDSYGRFLGMDDSHFTSFQLYKEVTDGCYWTIEYTEAGEAKIINKLNPTCFVAQSAGTQGTFYTNIAPAEAPETYNLPKLFVETSAAGIGDITLAPANGEARYYDLQGRAVSADSLTPGLYIRRQGGKAVKVMIR